MKIGTYSKSIYNFYKTLDHLDFELLNLSEQDQSCEGLIGGRINNDIITKHPNLKFNYIPYTGLNGINFDLAIKHHITVYNSHEHAKNVAERAMMLTLSLLGNLVEYHFNLTKGSFSNRNNENRVGWVSLFDQKVGIYGYGHIGKELSKLLAPFNCEVMVYDKYPQEEVKNASSLETLVELNDIIVIAVPLTSESKEVFDERLLVKMCDKFLINVGRGAVVKEEDLYNALNHHTLKGYGSDVWFKYPIEKDSLSFPSNYPIHEFKNVVMTPHCAAFSEGSKERVYKKVLMDIDKIVKGFTLNPVNLDDYK